MKMLRKAVVVACFTVFAAAALSVSMTAESFAHTNYITFSKPVRLPGVVLGSGSYIFELPDPNNAYDVVRVRSADRRQVFYTGFTRTVKRPFGLPEKQLVSFSEARSDAPTPITVWWPIGETYGREFKYEPR